jgi:hypothetical protein
LKSEGFDPVVFEQGERVGGQWSGDPHHSGVWPLMRTNTSRILTCFSDLSHDSGSPVYPTSQAMGDYLRKYADLFDLTPRIRLRSAVRELRRDASGGWIVKTDNSEGHYEQVVVATGRYNKPCIPRVPGLESFAGSGGVSHAFGYKRPEDYRGLRVLVAGCSISSLEIASDLAMSGAARVVVAHRNQRYVMPKIVAGVPGDHLVFNRFSALASETFPLAAVAAGLKQFILQAAGNPVQFGAPMPPDNVFEAKITQSQFFLPLVAEGRISVRPWIESVREQTVHFRDGSSEPFDAIVFGTGYDLHLPFLSDEIRRTLDLDACHIDLYKLTFHPGLPGLAFLGLFELMGPYYPVLELQGRWIAYTFSGARPFPSTEELEAGIAAYRARRGGSQILPNHTVAILFSRAAGVEPDLRQWPGLARALLFGPLTPMSFRISGRDSLPDAPEKSAAEAQLFGCMTSREFSAPQIAQLKALALARGDEAFRRYVEAVCLHPEAAAATAD